MAIQTRNKRDAGFNTASMSDLVFLLLIFFMLTSTLVSPNAIPLLLPQSNFQTPIPANVTIYIDDQLHYYLEETPTNEETLAGLLMEKLRNEKDASIVLRADKTVPIQHVANVFNAINDVNKALNTKYKLTLATAPKK